MKIESANIFGKADKVQVTIERLKQFEPKEGYFLAFSGGKDSQCIYHLSKLAKVKFDAHYNMTTIDPPEVIYFIRKYYPDVIFERPEKPFLTRLPEKGFPLRRFRWCCQEYKERGGSGRKVMTGIRWQESSKRKNRRMVEKCYRDSSITYINPIIDWTEKEVWKFLGNLPHCSLYDEGKTRIGCILCPMSQNRVQEAERWPRITKLFIQAFEKLYENKKYLASPTGKRGRKLNPSYKRWEDGRDMFDWWIHAGTKYGRIDKTVLFE